MPARLTEQARDRANANALSIVLENEAMVLGGEPIGLKRLNKCSAAPTAKIVLLAFTIVAVLLHIFGPAVAAAHDGDFFLFWTSPV